MHVGAEPDVVGQVPARVVRILVEDDVVPVPVPAIAVAVVVRGDAEEEAAEAEAIAVAALQPPDVVRAEGAREAPVRPGTIEVVVPVVPAGVVSDPTMVLSVHVRGVGMSRRLGEAAPSATVRGGRLAGGRTVRRRAVRRDVPTADFRPATLRAGTALAAPTLVSVVTARLRQSREGTAQQEGDESDQLLHAGLQSWLAGGFGPGIVDRFSVAGDDTPPLC